VSTTPPPPPPPPPFGGPPPPPPGYGGPPGPGGFGFAPYNTGRPPLNYAGFGARLGALLLDALIGLIFSIPGLIALFAGPRETTTCRVNGDLRLCEGPTGGTIGIAVLLFVAGAIAYMVIYCRMVSRGQSWGQKAAGVRIVDADNGGPIGAWRVFGRQFARILSGFLCYLGYLWMLWDSKKQTWHDKIVGTVVVKV
jgi:uncharacterized RDD family membrane protein YckC